MAQIPLTPQERQALIQIMITYAAIETSTRRETLLENLGIQEIAGIRGKLHLAGATEEFCHDLIRELQRFGTVPASGKPALTVLLTFLETCVAGHASERDFVLQLLARPPQSSPAYSWPATRPFRWWYIALVTLGMVGATFGLWQLYQWYCTNEATSAFTTAPQRLTAGQSNNIAPALSPGTTSIVFLSDRGQAPEQYNLWLMNPDGSEPIPLTDTPEREDVPAFSADGRYVAYTRPASVRATSSDIFLLEIDTSTVFTLTNTPEIDEAHPAFSPSDSDLIFVSNATGDYELYRAPLDLDNGVMGDSVLLVARPDYSDRRPFYSASGKFIYFRSVRRSEGMVVSAIYRLDLNPAAEGSENPVRLSREIEQSTEYGLSVSFSEQDTWLCYNAVIDGNEEIFVRNGAWQHPLAHNDTQPLQLTRSDARDGYCAISPFNQTIFYASTMADGTHFDLYRMDR